MILFTSNKQIKIKRGVFGLCLITCFLAVYLISSTNLSSNILNSKALANSSPNLAFSTFLGGSDSDYGLGIAIDDEGNYFITGETSSNDFPIKKAFDNTLNGSIDIFISKFISNGSLLWSTYVGGENLEHFPDVAIGDDGSCYVTGLTYSNDFPTKNAYNDSHNFLDDCFLTKFSSNGSLLWSTFFGGKSKEYFPKIACDNNGDCFITGYTMSSDFPIKNALDSSLNNTDGFIAKFSSEGLLLWSTFWGGSNGDSIDNIAIGNDGSFFVIGSTNSEDFPIKNAYDDTFNGIGDCFITKFSSDGNLLWSTFFGSETSNTDFCGDIVVGNDGSCFIIGTTEANDFPTKKAYDDTINGMRDIFIAKFSSSGSLLWSTYFGGCFGESANDIKIANDGNCFITGSTSSWDFPTINAYNNTLYGSVDVYIAVFSSFGSLLLSSYIGGDCLDYGHGIIIDNNDNSFITGTTNSRDFPIINASDSTFEGYYDAFVLKFDKFLYDNTLHISILRFTDCLFIFPILVFIFKKKKK